MSRAGSPLSPLVNVETEADIHACSLQIGIQNQSPWCYPGCRRHHNRALRVEALRRVVRPVSIFHDSSVVPVVNLLGNVIRLANLFDGPVVTLLEPTVVDLLLLMAMALLLWMSTGR